MSIPFRIAAISMFSGVIANNVTPQDLIPGNPIDVVRVVMTKHELSILQRAYLLDAIGDALPENLDSTQYARFRLMSNDRDNALDVWGNPYQIDEGNGLVAFSSAGPDGTQDTADDIVVSLRLT